uniref:UTP4 small subunit processome component n=1 Tax=Podarcis muralis TaxID=64176 RepID=A0A670INP7_PODMU
MVDFEVHRARLFAFVPSGIRCVAASRPSHHRLAVGRLDGSLEIYDLQANMFQEKVIAGHDTRIPEALCWTAGDRLFGAGLSGEIVEYNLEKLNVKYSLDAFGGPIWSMVADPTGTQLALGCDDGTIKLFNILPERIEFERQLDRQKGRTLSLSWHPSGTKIVAGSTNIIRVFDVKSGHAVQRILVDRCFRGSRKRLPVVVWDILFLSDGTIVSADSAGKVQFWDSEMGTLLWSHPVSKSAVLCLAGSEAEDSILVGTSEGMVYQFQLLPVKLDSAELQWVRTRPFKHHTHDVRTVAHLATTFISGGLDGELVIRQFMENLDPKSNESTLQRVTFPHRCLVSCARIARLLLFQYPKHLELWRLGATNTAGKAGEVLPVSCPPEHLLQLKAKDPEHIASSCVSPCGSWIAYSTTSRFYLHQVQLSSDHIAIKRGIRSAHHLLFSEDSTRLFVASDNGSVHILKLLQSGVCKHLHILRPSSETSEAAYLLAVSANGQWLAAASGDRAVNIYNLEDAKPHCTVPAYDCPVTALAIHPETNNVVIVHSDQQMFEFSITNKEYTPWSRKIQKLGLSKNWQLRETPITHIAFSPQQASHILLHDTFMFCILDSLKTALLDQTKGDHLAHCPVLTPLLFVDLLDKNCLVVVERSLADIKAQLPPPVYLKKFGT